jgi:hypothetical protein
MSVLSITAPQFTSEDERLEQETYTPEELDAAQKDVSGEISSREKENPEDDTPEAVPLEQQEQERQVLQQAMQQALQEIPLEEKDAYLEAMERVPQLIDLESPPHLFLKAEQDEPWAAAERLVNYWELRRWLFGDRAWLPMTSTGNGTLCQEDVELLKTGFCTLLDEDDAHNRGVICFQVTRRKLEYDRIAMVRVIFYVLTVALERPSVQENGLVLVADTKVRCGLLPNADFVAGRSTESRTLTSSTHIVSSRVCPPKLLSSSSSELHDFPLRSQIHQMCRLSVYGLSSHHNPSLSHLRSARKVLFPASATLYSIFHDTSCSTTVFGSHGYDDGIGDRSARLRNSDWTIAQRNGRRL